jgi:hypothetical protein
VLHEKGAGRPVELDENVESIREAFVRSPLSRLDERPLSQYIGCYETICICMLTSCNSYRPNYRVARDQSVAAMFNKPDEGNENLQKLCSLMVIDYTF